MKYSYYILILFAFLLSCKTSQQAADSVHTTTQQTAWEPTEKALLWQIEKKGYKTSFLYGTIHLIEGDKFFLPAKTAESIQASKKIVYEINMDDMTDMSSQMALLSKAFMKDGKTLSDLLSEDDYAMVSDHFEGLGLPMIFLNKIKPMFLSVLAGEDMNPNMLQDGSMKSYEMELDKLATQAGLTKGGLETIDYQLAIFDQIPYEDQAEMLVETIKMSEVESESTLDIYGEMYKTQDLKKMHDLTLTEESGMLKYADILLYNRNANWIPIMEGMMKKEIVFFAVGAGHLGGTKGVLALLKEKGFTVEPIR
jgi:uncharacterized protein YbaP (TraB family)